MSTMDEREELASGEIRSSSFLYTMPEAAKRFRVSERKLWQMAKDGILTSIRFGRSVRFTEKALLSCISAHEGKQL